MPDRANGPETAAENAAGEKIWDVTLENFEEAAVKSPQPVMLAFRPASDPLSARMEETMRTLARRYGGGIRFAWVDTEKEKELTGQLGISTLPSVLVLAEGRLCANMGGEQSLSYYRRLLDRLLEDLAEEGQNDRRLTLR